MNPVLEPLHWRYATKMFDASKKLTQEQLDTLLEALQLTASSYGLQPYKFVVVNNPELRTKIREKAWNQGQVTDASHLIVMCARTDVNADYVERYVKMAAETQGIDPAVLDGYKQMMLGFVNGKTPTELEQWATQQLYIAMGQVLDVAAELRVDACPMEGFDPLAVDEILGLAGKNLKSKLLCPVGFRSAEDHSAGRTKVRFPKEELFLFA